MLAMLKCVGFKFQVQANRRKGKSQSAKLDQSRIRLNRLRIGEKEILLNFKSGPCLQKHLGFHSNLSTYKRETLATFFRLMEDLCVTLYES